MQVSNVSATFTRPADTAVYASGDLVANSTTAGSVVPMSFPLGFSAGTGQTRITRIRLSKSGTTPTNATFRVHIYEQSPTVANGDNGAWSTNKSANYLGNIDAALMLAFSDGCATFGSAAAGSEFVLKLSSGSGTTLYALLEARAAYTPASAETFMLTLECLDAY